jgi:hypothetical protein
MRDYFSGGVSFGGGWGFYLSVLPKLFVYTMVYSRSDPKATNKNKNHHNTS